MATLPPSPLRTLPMSSEPLAPGRAWVGARTLVRVPRRPRRPAAGTRGSRSRLSAKDTAASQRPRIPALFRALSFFPKSLGFFWEAAGVVFKEEEMKLPHG